MSAKPLSDNKVQGFDTRCGAVFTSDLYTMNHEPEKYIYKLIIACVAPTMALCTLMP